jgi:hypothetical protein
MTRRGDQHGGGGYRALLESLPAITLMASPMNLLRSMTPAKLYVYDAVLGRLPENYHFPYLWLWGSAQDGKGEGH